MKTEIQKKENAQVEIKVVLPTKDLEKYRELVVKQALDNLEVDGFRKGKVPKEVADKHINSMKVLEEMAHRAISERYIDIIKDNDIKAIGNPQISITKIAEGSDLEFTLVTAVLPEITLPNYNGIVKALNKKEETIEVTEEEISSAILNLRKMRAQQDMTQKANESEDKQEVPSWNDLKEEDLPELNDEWVKSVGPFESLEDFNEKMKQNLQEEKKAKASDKKRLEMIDAILEESTIEVPELMVNYEVDKMMNEFEHNIAMTGMKFDEYLTSIKKTKEDYRKEWQEQGRKRAQTQLMLNHIATQEKIEPEEEEIEQEVTKILEQYKDNKQVDENSVRSYVSTILTHQKVFEYLENIK